MSRPKIVCVAKMFMSECWYRHTILNREIAGTVVLAIRKWQRRDAEFLIQLTDAEWKAGKLTLQQLDLAKIELADELHVMNIGGVIDTETLTLIGHAILHGKTVSYLVPLAPTPDED